jgi:hypothetical protein
MSLRLIKALALIRITLTSGESSLSVTLPERSARVRNSSGLGCGSGCLSAQPLTNNISPNKMDNNLVVFCILAPYKINLILPFGSVYDAFHLR